LKGEEGFRFRAAGGGKVKESAGKKEKETGAEKLYHPRGGSNGVKLKRGMGR